MASEEHEVESESLEQLAQRIRWHLRQADEKRASEIQTASRHEKMATELIEKLSRRVKGKAQSYGAKAFGRGFEQHEEVVVEIFIKLDRALRNYETRKGLEERFDATFHSIAIDAIRSVRGSNRGFSGDTVHGIAVMSADNPASEDDQEKWSPESREDSNAEQAFFSLIDRIAFESIAPRIPPRQREVLRMRAEGHEFCEIGKTLRINRDTASADYQRALLFIKNNILPERGGDTK